MNEALEQKLNDLGNQAVLLVKYILHDKKVYPFAYDRATFLDNSLSLFSASIYLFLSGVIFFLLRFISFSSKHVFLRNQLYLV